MRLDLVCVVEQMAELKRVIDEDQRTYVQWAEEKLSLANIAADLLVQHRTAVDKDVGSLLAELKVSQLRFMSCPSEADVSPNAWQPSGRCQLVSR